MLFKSAAAFVLLASSAAAHYVLPRASGNSTRLCGTPEPTEKQIAASKAMLEKEKEMRAKGESRALASFSVNTYFHVVASSRTVAGGYLTVSELTEGHRYTHVNNHTATND